MNLLRHRPACGERAPHSVALRINSGRARGIVFINSFQKPAGIINLMITRILIVAVLVVTLAAPAYADQKKAESSSDGLDDLIGALGGGGRKTSLDEGGSSHSIRGLSRASGGKGATKPEAENSVKSMESFSVSAEDIAKFRKDGGLK